MELVDPYLMINTIVAAMAGLLLLLLLSGAVSVLWLTPARKWRRLRRNGFVGPVPRFPLGNLMQMSRLRGEAPPSPASSSAISHDIHSFALPYLSRWREDYGKVFVYWIGAEPFLYVADPEFLKLAATGAMSEKWGKPDVFKHDRKPMFGNGLVMVEGNDWTIHRNIIAPAFSMTNLNGMISVMEETTCKMVAKWDVQLRLAPGRRAEIDVEKEISRNAAEIISKASFGMSEEKGKKVFEKLHLLQNLLQKELFLTNRLVGVPFGKVLKGKKSYEAWRIGKEIDRLLHDIISSRKDGAANSSITHQDLLGLLLAGNQENALLERKLTTRELVDECKTFFFGGHETTGLALSWALLLLAQYPQWQTALREEAMEVTGGGPLDSAMLSQLTKMGWVWNEVLRLYSPAPNLLRQAREDIRVSLGGGEEVVIPKGTNMWVDVVGMHHDAALWGEDVNDFNPERFMKEVHGGCKHRMGFLPFGFSGRICVGRNLSSMEFRIVLCLLLRRFSFSLSPAYTHSPTHMFTLRPSLGVPLVVGEILRREISIGVINFTPKNIFFLNFILN